MDLMDLRKILINPRVAADKYENLVYMTEPAEGAGTGSVRYLWEGVKERQDKEHESRNLTSFRS